MARVATPMTVKRVARAGYVLCRSVRLMATNGSSHSHNIPAISVCKPLECPDGPDDNGDCSYPCPDDNGDSACVKLDEGDGATCECQPVTTAPPPKSTPDPPPPKSTPAAPPGPTPGPDCPDCNPTFCESCLDLCGWEDNECHVKFLCPDCEVSLLCKMCWKYCLPQKGKCLVEHNHCCLHADYPGDGNCPDPAPTPDNGGDDDDGDMCKPQCQSHCDGWW